MPKRKQRISPLESDIQAAFIEWCALNEQRLPALKAAFAVANGDLRPVTYNPVTGRRYSTAGQKLRRMGVRPGVPDWMCPAPSPRGWNGLAIEFKSATGSLSPAQRAYIEILRKQVWFVEVCRTVEEAIGTVERYFEPKKKA